MNSDLLYFFQTSNPGKVPIDLSSRGSVVRMLRNNGVTISESAAYLIEGLDEDKFWEYMKVFWVLKTVPSKYLPEHKHMIGLFESLSSGIEVSYRFYRDCGFNYKSLFLSLLTMFRKGLSPNYGGVRNSNYLRAMNRNRPYAKKVIEMAIRYGESPMREVDFMSFLLNMGNYRK